MFHVVQYSTKNKISMSMSMSMTGTESQSTPCTEYSVLQMKLMVIDLPLAHTPVMQVGNDQIQFGLNRTGIIRIRMIYSA